MGGRAIVRSDARHGDAADSGWLQRLLLHPAPAADRARRGAGRATGGQRGDAGKLALLAFHKRRKRLRMIGMPPRQSRAVFNDVARRPQNPPLVETSRYIVIL